MSSTAKQIANMVEMLPVKEQSLIFELVSRLLPDDMATPEDMKAIEEARAEYARGETILLDDVVNG
jgi:hypothetical protein